MRGGAVEMWSGWNIEHCHNFCLEVNALAKDAEHVGDPDKGHPGRHVDLWPPRLVKVILQVVGVAEGVHPTDYGGSLSSRRSQEGGERWNQWLASYELCWFLSRGTAPGGCSLHC